LKRNFEVVSAEKSENRKKKSNAFSIFDFLISRR